MTLYTGMSVYGLPNLESVAGFVTFTDLIKRCTQWGSVACLLTGVAGALTYIDMITRYTQGDLWLAHVTSCGWVC
jgi:hypothetical protein